MAINDVYLNDDAVEELRERIGQSSNRYLVLDDFLAPQHLAPLQQLITEQGEFTRNLKVKPDASVVKHLEKAKRYKKIDAETFEAANADEQFISQNIFTAPKPGHEKGKPANTDKLIRKIISHPAMYRWLEQLSGETILRSAINLKSHGTGHFLKKHSDSRGNRKICTVLYLHDHWKPEYKGRFMLHMHDGSVQYIDPLPNRLILFDTSVENLHEIEELGVIPDDWLRMNYSFWFA